MTIDASATRLDPFPTPVSAFFWEGACNGEFLGQQCGNCASYWHPPRPMCPKCHSLDQRHVKFSGRGVVYSWTMPVHPFPFGFTSPPIVALIDLEEGTRIVSNVVGVNPLEMREGLEVEVVFEATEGGKAVPVFRLREGAGA
jgi:uncharacterized OB-fold protein